MTVDPGLVPFATVPPHGRYSDPVRRRAEVRDHLRQLLAAEPAWTAEVSAEDVNVPGLDDAPPVRVRILRPAEAEESNAPCVLWLHGGGFIAGDLDTDVRISGRYAYELGVVVVHVDYQLAPEHPYPAAVLDGHAALRWVVGNAADLGVDAARIVVAGSSAGGALATAVCLRSHHIDGFRPAYLALLHPVLDDRMTSASSRNSPDTPAFTTDMVTDMWRHYLGNLEPGSAAVPAYAAPARAADLRVLPPTYVMIAGLDPLHDEGRDFAGRLDAAGVLVALDRWDGAFHGFMNFDADIARRATDCFLDAVRAAAGESVGPLR